MYDTGANKIQLHRVDYDIEKCQRKIREAEVAGRLSSV